MFAKSLGIRYTKDQRRRLGIQAAQIQLQCEDPRIYSVPLVTASIPGTLTLGGNRDSTGIITINGPRTDPWIVLGDTVLALNYTIPDGSTVTIDLYNKLIFLNGSTNIRRYLSVGEAGWPVLGPGSNTFTVPSGSGSGTISVSARSAWR